MSEKNDEVLRPTYDYPSDGLVRRILHEMGARQFAFYIEALRPMDYRPSDVALDIGAGMGSDGLYIAGTYAPRVMYLLEPPSASFDEQNGGYEEFDNKYYHIPGLISSQGLDHVKLLRSELYPQTTAAISQPDSQLFTPGTSYLQPVPGYAESIPLPDESIDKPSIIHADYHFSDRVAAMRELYRIMKSSSTGLLINNGVEDKLVFKEKLNQQGAELENVPPATVSSVHTYEQSIEDIIGAGFEIVDILHYQDDMLITPDRKPIYLGAFDTYRSRFERRIINDGRWSQTRKKVLDNDIDRAIASYGFFIDSIDIAAIYFKKK